MPKELSEKISSGIIRGLSDNLRGSEVIFITTTFFFPGKGRLAALKPGCNIHD